MPFKEADALASSLYFALKVNLYGGTELGYLPQLKKTLYRHKGVVLGYGLKLWPEDHTTVKAQAPEVVKLEGPRGRGGGVSVYSTCS